MKSIPIDPGFPTTVTPRPANGNRPPREDRLIYLMVRFETRDRNMEQFRGAACLQPYLPSEFADRVSGVTLDALSHGAPVVTLEGTWMGHVVNRFGAGIVVREAKPELLLEGVEEILRDYGRYRRNALQAGGALQQELSASRLFEIVTA